MQKLLQNFIMSSLLFAQNDNYLIKVLYANMQLKEMLQYIVNMKLRREILEQELLYLENTRKYFILRKNV